MTNKNKAPTDNITEGALEKWPPLKKALWKVVTSEKLNDGHYIKAIDLVDRLYEQALAALQNAQSDHIDTYPWDEVADNICKSVAGMTIEEETISVTMKVDTFRRCIREALNLGLQQNAQSVDVEAIKREVIDRLPKLKWWQQTTENVTTHIVAEQQALALIDHLAAQGYLPKPGFVVPESLSQRIAAYSERLQHLTAHPGNAKIGDIQKMVLLLNAVAAQGESNSAPAPEKEEG